MPFFLHWLLQFLMRSKVFFLVCWGLGSPWSAIMKATCTWGSQGTRIQNYVLRSWWLSEATQEPNKEDTNGEALQSSFCSLPFQLV